MVRPSRVWTNAESHNVTSYVSDSERKFSSDVTAPWTIYADVENYHFNYPYPVKCEGLGQWATPTGQRDEYHFVD